MNNGSEAADQVVRFALQGTVFLLKVSGQSTATILSFLAAAASQDSKVSGKTRLKHLLQSGSDLKVFTVQGQDNYHEFIREAKRYGMLFSVVKRTKDDRELGIYDIMVRAEDASKLNRIIEKHHLAEVSATTRSVDSEEVSRSQLVEARDLLAKMLEQDGGRNPEEALEGPSRSDALSRVPNQASRRSVIEEVEKYAAESNAATAAKTPAAVMPNLMSGEEIGEKESEDEEEQLHGLILNGEEIKKGREV